MIQSDESFYRGVSQGTTRFFFPKKRWSVEGLVLVSKRCSVLFARGFHWEAFGPVCLLREGS